MVQFFHIVENQSEVEKPTPLIWHHKDGVIDPYLDMVNSSVRKVCICKTITIIFNCCCCGAIFIHFPHIKDRILISSIQKIIVWILSSVLQQLLLSYLLSTFVSFAKYFLRELGAFPYINLMQHAVSKLLSFLHKQSDVNKSVDKDQCFYWFYI